MSTAPGPLGSSRRPGARLTPVWIAVVLVGGILPAAAQTPPAANASPPAAVTEPSDPLGRDTPRGTIAGFNQAVHRDDFVTAARYLQLSTSQRSNTERLARDLTELMDRYFNAPITSLSAAAAGAVDDGLPLDRERMVLMIGGESVDVDLVRVKDRQSGLVWLISSQTLATVPALRRAAVGTWVERIMPDSLNEATLLGVPLAQWIAWAATILVPLAALWLLSVVFILLARRIVTDATHRGLLESWYGGLRWLAVVIMTLAVHLVQVPSLGFSLRFRLIYSRLAIAVAVVLAAWFLWRLLARSFEHARIRAQRRGQASLRSLLMLAERVSKVLIVLLAIFALLTVAGVDTTTALAGVGIGGVAIALGAQKSVENLLGGVFLLTDRALAVGDTCSISDRIGVVEDITMRSVRLRTVEQTLLSVPAGVLSQANVENFATRNKILVQALLRLRYGTTSDQLRHVLSDIGALLESHPDLETSTSRIRLVNFGERAIELELFCYVLTPDFMKFLSVREDLLLHVATIIESSGTGFAQPSLIYEERAAAAANLHLHARSS